MKEELQLPTPEKTAAAIAAVPIALQKKAVLPPLDKRYAKDQLEEEITANFGIVTVICAKLDCTPKQFYNTLDKLNLRECLKQAKQQLVGIAERAILECLHSENEQVKLRAAETTLKSLGKEEWSQAPQVQIAQQIVADKELEIKNIFGIQ